MLAFGGCWNKPVFLSVWFRAEFAWCFPSLGGFSVLIWCCCLGVKFGRWLFSGDLGIWLVLVVLVCLGRVAVFGLL